MTIYWDMLAHIQVVINCRYCVTQLCTSEVTLAHNLGAQYLMTSFKFDNYKTSEVMEINIVGAARRREEIKSFLLLSNKCSFLI